MTLLLSDTFTDRLAKLTGDEQKVVKTTAFDLPTRDHLLVTAVDPASEFLEELI